MVAPDDPGEAEQDAPRERSDHDRGHRGPEPETRDEERTGEEHEQPDAEVRPQHEAVEEAEHAVAVGDGLDAELGRRQVVARGSDDQGMHRHQKATYPFRASSTGSPASSNRTVPAATRVVTSPRTVRPPSMARVAASSSASRGSNVNSSS
jgi:hypothetical protein